MSGPTAKRSVLVAGYNSNTPCTHSTLDRVFQFDSITPLIYQWYLMCKSEWIEQLGHQRFLPSLLLLCQLTSQSMSELQLLQEATCLLGHHLVG